MNEGDVKLLQDTGHFTTDLGSGTSFGSQGWGRRGWSGGPAFGRGRVVGVNCAGGHANDIAVTSRVFLEELENMTKKDFELRKSEYILCYFAGSGRRSFVCAFQLSIDYFAKVSTREQPSFRIRGT